MSELILCYWNYRGKAEPLSMLLNTFRLSYVFKGYDYGNCLHWFNIEMNELNTHFPKLPYLKDGVHTETGSEPIALQICKKANREDMAGITFADRINIARLGGVIMENIYHIKYLAKYGKDHVNNVPSKENNIFQMSACNGKLLTKETIMQNSKNRSWDQLINSLKYLNSYLENNEFINNGNLCYMDFYLYELVFIAKKIFSQMNEIKALEQFTNLQKHFERIQNLSSIKEYLHSNRYNTSFLIYVPDNVKYNDSSTL